MPRSPLLAALLALLAGALLLARRPSHRATVDTPAPPPGAPAAAALLWGQPLDLNRATADDLAALPGIGPARAQAILELRKSRGRLENADELLDVPGIGPATLEALRGRLSTR